jgi:hypothetical protein
MAHEVMTIDRGRVTKLPMVVQVGEMRHARASFLLLRGKYRRELQVNRGQFPAVDLRVTPLSLNVGASIHKLVICPQESVP